MKVRIGNLIELILLLTVSIAMIHQLYGLSEDIEYCDFYIEREFKEIENIEVKHILNINANNTYNICLAKDSECKILEILDDSTNVFAHSYFGHIKTKYFVPNDPDSIFYVHNQKILEFQGNTIKPLQVGKTLVTITYPQIIRLYYENTDINIKLPSSCIEKETVTLEVYSSKETLRVRVL